MKYYAKMVLSWICGVEHQGEADNKSPAIPTISPTVSDHLLWEHICNTNGVIILALCTFLWAFFTDYRIDKIYKSS